MRRAALRPRGARHPARRSLHCSCNRSASHASSGPEQPSRVKQTLQRRGCSSPDVRIGRSNAIARPQWAARIVCRRAHEPSVPLSFFGISQRASIRMGGIGTCLRGAVAQDERLEKNARFAASATATEQGSRNIARRASRGSRHRSTSTDKPRTLKRKLAPCRPPIAPSDGRRMRHAPPGSFRLASGRFRLAGFGFARPSRPFAAHACPRVGMPSRMKPSRAMRLWCANRASNRAACDDGL